VTIEQIKQPNRAIRRHSKKQSKLLIKGIQEFGFTTPLLVDNDYTLVTGVARLEAAKAIGMDVVPIIRISHLTDDNAVSAPRNRARLPGLRPELAGWTAETASAETEWCRLGDSNTRPPHYECGALPAELRRPTVRQI
jgi:hypothetical protein